MSYTEPDTTEQRLFDEPVYVDDATKYRRLAPCLVLAIPMIIAFVFLYLSDSDMRAWAVSGPRLADGDIELIFLHMFAHGSLAHIVFNLSALLGIGPAIMERLGPLNGRSAAAFFLLFFGSGFAGMLLWLALHPTSTIPMLGASGAIFGFLGFLVRQPDPQVAPVQLSSPVLRQSLWSLLKDQFVLIALFALPLLFGSGFMGLAWESHLGGLIAGLLFCPWLWRFAGGRPDWVMADEEESH